MGMPVLIMGKSGAGKSASLRNFVPDEVGIFSVSGKPLPFRSRLPVCKTKDYNLIRHKIRSASRRIYVIDDSQYLMAFEFFARAKEQGFQKFTDIGLHFQQLLDDIIFETPDDEIVYFLHHTETSDLGEVKAKTIGKLLDEKITLEGLFNIVLLAKTDGKQHWLETQSDGFTTAKSPMGMFPGKMDNDLKAVDTAIRDYWFGGGEEIEGQEETIEETEAENA